MAEQFAVILADPPWSFRDRGSRVAPDFADRHYAVQSIDDIMGMGVLVQRLVSRDALLFLWAPNAFVLDGQAQTVARAWGFAVKQMVPWLKTTIDGQRPAIGFGHYTRVCTEQLLVCRRGRARVTRRDVPGVIFAPRTRHSAKPDEAYQLIERLCDGPLLELYARRRYSDRWTVWGDQLN